MSESNKDSEAMDKAFDELDAAIQDRTVRNVSGEAAPTAESLPGQVVRDAINLALEVRDDKAASPREFAIARAFVEFFGAGPLVEQNERLEKWARDADERVGEAHAVLKAAGISAGPIGAMLTIGERVQVLAAERDAFKSDHLGACGTIADMHAAAMGKVCGPMVGVVEDVANVRAELEDRRRHMANDSTVRPMLQDLAPGVRGVSVATPNGKVAFGACQVRWPFYEFAASFEIPHELDRRDWRGALVSLFTAGLDEYVVANTRAAAASEK